MQVDGSKGYIGGVVRQKKEFEDILIGGTINCILFVSVVKNDLVNNIKSCHSYMMLFMSMCASANEPLNKTLFSFYVNVQFH